ncbi:MAG: c-type cytochrome biogenesis protein CcmI, partial [Hyphomicrobiales bacterium]
MVFWPILALMAAVSVGLVLRPLLGGRRAGADRNSYAAAVYRDQLASLETEQAGGLIGEVEAKAIRAEVGRRLMAIEKATASAPMP